MRSNLFEKYLNLGQLILDQNRQNYLTKCRFKE